MTDDERFETLNPEQQAFWLSVQSNIGCKIIQGMNSATTTANEQGVTVFDIGCECQIEMPDGSLWQVFLQRIVTPTEEAMLNAGKGERPN